MRPEQGWWLPLASPAQVAPGAGLSEPGEPRRAFLRDQALKDLLRLEEAHPSEHPAVVRRVLESQEHLSGAQLRAAEVAELVGDRLEAELVLAPGANEGRDDDQDDESGESEQSVHGFSPWPQGPVKGVCLQCH